MQFRVLSLLFVLGGSIVGFSYCADSTTDSPTAINVDRRCGEDLGNLWLDVVAVVDNSIGMTDFGLTDIAASIASVFSNNTRIGVQDYEPRTTRVGLVTYNAVANTAASLDKYQSINDLYNGVFTDLAKVSSTDESYLANGLAAAEQILEAGKHDYNRSHYQKVVIVYASTYKGDGSLNPLPVAERLKSSGVIIVTVAYDQAGDGALLADLAKIATLYYNFSNTDNGGNTLGEIQGALLQANCFCPNSWTQFRVEFSDVYSYRYGLCLQAVGLTAVWRAARLSCQNRWPGSFLVNEYHSNKHDYVLSLVENTTGFAQPFTYHIGLSLSVGQWKWDQPAGAPQKPLVEWNDWNNGFPIASSSLTAVLNQQSSSVVATGWQNVQPWTTSANYVCEVVSCDTDNYCDSLGDELKV
ncbi:unnamed protein product [Caenorhabditis sp. 36 PRJEB53466]|nr:unnamed protein product [Caenorhabditis sp. 36 PRJEB53466]